MAPPNQELALYERIQADIATSAITSENESIKYAELLDFLLRVPDSNYCYCEIHKEGKDLQVLEWTLPLKMKRTMNYIITNPLMMQKLAVDLQVGCKLPVGGQFKYTGTAAFIWMKTKGGQTPDSPAKKSRWIDPLVAHYFVIVIFKFSIPKPQNV